MKFRPIWEAFPHVIGGDGYSEEDREALVGTSLWLLSTAVGTVTSREKYEVPHLGSTGNYDLERGLNTRVDYLDILESRVQRFGCALDADSGEILFADGIIPSEVFKVMRQVYEATDSVMKNRKFEAYGINFIEVDP